MDTVMKKWHRLGIIGIMAAALPLSACGVSGPELTEEQNAQIVEYAAGLMLKYDENYHSRLEEEPDEELSEEPAEPVEQPKEEEPEEVPVDAESPEEIVQEQEEVADKSIEEFCGIEGTAISYTGYEVKDTYPEATGDDLFFAMNASDGCKLIVLNFNVQNIGSQDLNLDMLSIGTKFKISLNEASPKYALTTMLENDLASYIGTIPAGSSENLVLICELPEEEAGSIETVRLFMRNGSEEARLTLN